MEFDRTVRTTAVLGRSVSVLGLSGTPLKHFSLKVFGRAWWPWSRKAGSAVAEPSTKEQIREQIIACFHSGGICVRLVSLCSPK